MAYDLTGQRFGSLLVVGFDREGTAKARNGMRHWWCKCACGCTVSIRGDNLRNGHTKSCGCLARYNRKRKRLLAPRNTQANVRKHGCFDCLDAATCDFKTCKYAAVLDKYSSYAEYIKTEEGDF